MIFFMAQARKTNVSSAKRTPRNDQGDQRKSPAAGGYSSDIYRTRPAENKIPPRRHGRRADFA